MTVDFSANRSPLNAETLYADPYRKRAPRITRFNILFGPNGSGKSNWIEAVAFFRFVIAKKMPQKGVSNLANAFAGKSADPIGRFSATFSISSLPFLFTYALAVDYLKCRIVEEKLSTNKGTVYEMALDPTGFPSIKLNERQFTRKDEKDQFRNYAADYSAKMNPTKSFLSWLAQYEKDDSRIREVERFFRTVLDIFYKIVIFSPTPTAYEDLKDIIALEGGRVEAIKNELNALGIRVNKITLDPIDAKAFAEKTGFSPEDVEEISNIYKKRLKEGETHHFVHNGQPYYFGLNQEGNIIYYKIVLTYDKDVVLDFDQESTGTQKIINMLPLLISDRNNDDSLFLIDEVDRSLHTILAKRFVQEVIRQNKSRNNQFFFTAHDPYLLDVELFRMDEMFLLENETHSSTLRRLDTADVRIDRDIRKKFVKGQITFPETSV